MSAKTYSERFKGSARNAYNKVKSSAKNTYTYYRAKANDYGRRLDTSYTYGYRKGYNDAVNYGKFVGSHVAGAYGYYSGIKAYGKSARIKKRLSD